MSGTLSGLTTPFGRRPVSLGHVAAQVKAGLAREEALSPGSNAPAAVHKWRLFRQLTEARHRLGVSDRTLGVLNALLTFHSETALALSGAQAEDDDGDPACDLMVFPSNRALCQRAHGMAEQTLRRHIAALVDAGLLIRRDSPSGKRYARKAREEGDRFAQVFGFDLTPLVARAAEIEALAEETRRDARALALVRERISLFRRDLAKLIALGLDEGLPGDWAGFRERFLALAAPLRRIEGGEPLEALEAALSRLRAEVSRQLEQNSFSEKTSGNDAVFERHQSNSKHISTPESEPAFEQAGSRQPRDIETKRMPDDAGDEAARERTLQDEAPLGLVIEACPDIVEYAPDGRVGSWSDFLAAARAVRPMLGVSPDAWREAVEAMGEPRAAIAVAGILQRSEHSSEAAAVPGANAGATIVAVNGSPAIRSAGGYLRALTHKARAGEFAAGPILMALLGQRLKAARGRALSATAPDRCKGGSSDL